MQFIDYLTAMMTLSMAINLEVMYMSYRLGSGAARDELKSIGLVMMMLGVPTTIFGLTMSITWPLPGSYNILFGDAFLYLGIVTLIGGLLLYGVEPDKFKASSFPVAFLSLITIIYGASIYTHGLTNSPVLAFAFYLFEGLSGIVTALLLYRRTKSIAYTVIALLVIATIIMLIIDVGAIFQHPALFAKYSP
ncbi:MAG: DUF981 family protein [Thermocladium sp.]